jgi:2-hydroxy-3-keto-5-methylthiopentenyl-1-phosphate phosphatase
MDINKIKAAFLSVATLRAGAKDLFTVCELRDIPTVVLSSGIRNVIEIIAEHYDIHPGYILSNDLTVDNTGFVRGWRRETLVHMLNKNEMGHDELSRLRHERPNVLLLGDVPDDTRMVVGDSVLRIRVLDPRKGEGSTLEGALQASFDAGYDLAVMHDLAPAAHILQWLTSVH